MKRYHSLVRFFVFAGISMLLAWQGQLFVHGNEKAVDIIVNVFSILTGFLIAIMSFYSDMQFDEDTNWRQLEIRERQNQLRYTKHSLLFYSYLTVLVCVFIVVLLRSNQNLKDGQLIKFFEYIYLWLSCISIFYSTLLPSNLIKNRREEFKRLLKKKKPNGLD